MILGRSGILTLDALQWLMDMGVALLFINPDGKLTSTLVPGGLEGSKARLHRAQAIARDTELGVRIARVLIKRKLQGQLGILNWLTDPGRQIRVEERGRWDRMRSAAETLKTASDELDGTYELETIVEVERAGAEKYWRSLAGLPIHWTRKAGKNVPQHWLLTNPRESYRTGNRYGATDPVNALLNYGYALLEAETRIACLNAGLHPGLGIFHADKEGRSSFVYDLMEAGRPSVDRLIFEFIQKHYFAVGECWETREGICRIDPQLAAEIVLWSPKFRSSATSTVKLVKVLLAAAGTC